MEKTELVYVTFIRTTPEKLWSAITDPEFTRQYWGGFENVSTWNTGTAWEHIDDEEGKRVVMVAGEVLESVPPKRLVLSWAKPGEEGDKSRLTFEIEPVEDMVSLTVKHGGFATDSVMMGKVSWGWPRVLSSMKSFLETGKGLNIFAGC